MSERLVSTIRRGMDYTFVIASEVGDDTSSYTCTADIKRLPGGRNSYTPSATVVDSFTVTEFAGGELEDGTEVGPGWNLELSGTQTLDLAVGTYMADALIDLGSTDYITKSWVLEVVETVTRA